MAISRRRPFGVDFRQLGDALVQSAKAADVAQGDEPDGHDAHSQQDALHGIHVGHRSQAPRRHVDDDDQRQQPHAEPDGEQLVGENVEEETGGPQLQAEVRYREDEGHQHGEDTHQVGAEVIGVHLARRHVAEALAEHPLAFQKNQAGEGNGNCVERGVGVLETVAVDKAGMAYERPARERRGGGGKHKHPQGNRAPGDEVVRGRAGRTGSLHPPVDAIDPVQDHKDE